MWEPRPNLSHLFKDTFLSCKATLQHVCTFLINSLRTLFCYILVKCARACQIKLQRDIKKENKSEYSSPNFGT